MKWHRGRIHSRVLEGAGSYGLVLIEIRDDIAKGWAWTLSRGPNSVSHGICDTLEQAKRTALREAKRRGWAP